MEKDLVLDVALALAACWRHGWAPTSSTPATTIPSFRWRRALRSPTSIRPTCLSHPRQLQQRSSARGVETYYLNFTSNADALEVAARENAVSQSRSSSCRPGEEITLKERSTNHASWRPTFRKPCTQGWPSALDAARPRREEAPFVGADRRQHAQHSGRNLLVPIPPTRQAGNPEYREKIAESV